MCDVNTIDAAQWDEWLAVVVPGYGQSYIRSSDVVAVEKRLPSQPVLPKFYQSPNYDQYIDETPNVLHGVLSLIGRRLVHLDIGDYLPLELISDLRQVLSLCPSLESLAVDNSGELWSDEEAHRLLPNLRELQLRVDDSEQGLAMLKLPRSLQLLRIDVERSMGSYTQSHDAVKHILMQPSALRVFHWCEELIHSYQPTPYTETYADTA